MVIECIEPVHPCDSNIYVVIGERTALIDTGAGQRPSELLARLDSVLRGRPPDLIILTHCHFDHVGGVAMLVERFGCDVFAGHKDAVVLRRGDDSVIMGQTIGVESRPVEVRDLFEGDVIDLGGHRLRVICTPGHTSGGICLHDETTGALFTGDTVFAYGVGRTDFSSGSPAELLLSLKRLSGLDVQGLYPGHGQLLRSGGMESIRNGILMMRDYI